MRHALDGVKILDFTWVVAGPLGTKFLGDYGAMIVKVESRDRPDPGRATIPHINGRAGVNRSAMFAVYNTSKYDVTLNLAHPKGPEIARRLVLWADVIVENLTPGALEKWGLGYEELKRLKEDIIMVSVYQQGKAGPHARHSGLGGMFAGLTGMAEVTGWPDRGPTGMANPYTDYVLPLYIVCSIIGALEYRDREGKGQHVDLSQVEGGISFLRSMFLDYTINKRVQTRMGNRFEYLSPRGAYRCQGDDKWCVISVSTDQEWKSLQGIIGSPALEHPRFATISGRKENEDELDKLIEAWTINQSPEEVMTRMQAGGVPAGVVKTGKDLCEDPQLDYRGHFCPLEHPEMGLYRYERAPFRLSKTPDELRNAPCLGQDNYYVFTQMLGMSDEEFANLVGTGVF